MLLDPLNHHRRPRQHRLGPFLPRLDGAVIAREPGLQHPVRLARPKRHPHQVAYGLWRLVGLVQNQQIELAQPFPVPVNQRPVRIVGHHQPGRARRLPGFPVRTLLSQHGRRGLAFPRQAPGVQPVLAVHVRRHMTRVVRPAANIGHADRAEIVHQLLLESFGPGEHQRTPPHRLGERDIEWTLSSAHRNVVRDKPLLLQVAHDLFERFAWFSLQLWNLAGNPASRGVKKSLSPSLTKSSCSPIRQSRSGKLTTFGPGRGAVLAAPSVPAAGPPVPATGPPVPVASAATTEHR